MFAGEHGVVLKPVHVNDFPACQNPSWYVSTFHPLKTIIRPLAISQVLNLDKFGPRKIIWKNNL
jgi:hypothetical protein